MADKVPSSPPRLGVLFMAEDRGLFFFFLSFFHFLCGARGRVVTSVEGMEVVTCVGECDAPYVTCLSGGPDLCSSAVVSRELLVHWVIKMIPGYWIFEDFV